MSVAELGIDVLMDLNTWCLVHADDDDLARLRVSFSVSVLDTDPESGHYVYAAPDPRLDRSLLARHGTVLTEDADGVVLRTTDQGIRGLNTLQVELVGINMYPLVLTERLAKPPPTATSDSLVWELVNRVSTDTLEAMLVRLREFVTRYTETESCFSAMEWVRSRFEAWGCSTYLDTFRPGWAPSAIGVKCGTQNPDAVFVICGHADALSEIPFTLTPGSEDNASGTAAVLELCRATADMEFDNTVWFIGFSGEEQGLIGSDSFARRARDRDDSIVLAINFDMISYGRESMDSIVIYGALANPGSEPWVDFFIAHADTFSDLKYVKTMENRPARRSDHYSFWKYGFPAIRGGYWDMTPHYHKTGDTIGPLYYEQCGTNNIPMHAEVVKALVATVARLGGAHVPVGILEPDRDLRPLRVERTIPSAGPPPVEVRLSAPIDSRTPVRVYDATGTLVRTLFPAQDRLIVWGGCDQRGRRLAPGIYLLHLESGSRTLTAKLMLTE